jgi:hypothetical protein
MKEIMLQVLVAAYGLVGLIGLSAYWPTIKDLYRHKKPSANITSFVLWTVTSIISFLYATFVLKDVLVQSITGLNFVACATVVVLSIGLKKRCQ